MCKAGPEHSPSQAGFGSEFAVVETGEGGK